MNKVFCFLLAAVFSLFFVPVAFAASPVAGETTYINNFDSQSDVEDFQAYYILEAGQSQEESFDSHWAYENGFVKRINDIAEGSGTKYIAALTLKDMTFKNFELSVKVQKVGDDWTWPVIGIRQNFPGKYFLDDGLGVFMQDEGKATFWGSTEVGGPYEGSANSSYSKNATHTIKIRAVNDLVTVFVDGKQANEKSFSSLEREGYITLMSVNTEAVFDDFSITKLDDDGNPTAIIEQEISSAVDSASFSSDGTDLSEAVSGESTSSEDTASIDKGVYLGELETGNNGGSTALWIFVIVSDIVIIGGAAAVYIFLILPRLPKK